MADISDTPLYDNVVRITNVYLGPAADRFISRQVQNHLNKSPEDLTKKDLLKLIDWIRIAVSLITDDVEIIDEYTLQLEKLAKGDSDKTIRQIGDANG
jgi:hypothetical protein